MILITQFWNFGDPKRKDEIYKCLLKNASNRYISKIYVFSENNSNINFTHNKIVSLTENHRMSYYELFKAVNQNFRNQICIIANADVYFDESVVKLNQFDFKNRIIALSSYDSETNVLDDYSFDSWILKSINIPYSEFEIGKSHDDLRLLKTLKENGIEIINPSKEILSYHIDKNKSLKFTPNEKLDYIKSSKLKDNSVVEEVEIIEKTVVIKQNIKRKPVIPKRIANPIKPKPIINQKTIIKPKPVTTKPVKHITPVPVPVITTTNINKEKKIAVVLHLYYQDLWDEFNETLKNLNSYDFDIYVTLTKDSATLGQTRWIKEKIENDYMNAKVFIIDNKGLDVGAFLIVLEHLSLNNKNYDYLLKLHTKKSVKTAGIEFGSNWRKQLYTPLIGGVNIVNNILNTLNNDNIGMIGNTKWISDYQGLNKQNVSEINNILGVNTNSKKFIGGTMFWIKYPILQRYFNQLTIKKIYNLLEVEYFTDYERGTYTHALERVLGQLVSDSGKIISGA